MEKATSVYNKLKLQFIGKIETGKPKPDEKNQESNEQDTQNTGKLWIWNVSTSFQAFKPVLKYAFCLRFVSFSQTTLNQWTENQKAR